MSSLRPREDARRWQERPHVLIITDDPSLSGFLGEGLVMGGFWTSVISHGLQVLEVFRLRTFDLIVLDYELGTFDAFELLQRLRGASPTEATVGARTQAPIVIMSSAPVELSGSDQERFGISAIIRAPVELEDVVHTLHETFARWREHHPDAPLADESPGD